MKRLIMIMLAAVMSAAAFAQTSSIGAGYETSTLSDGETSINFTGPYVKYTYDYYVPDEGLIIGFRSGLIWSLQSADCKVSYGFASAGATIKEHYLSIPLHLTAQLGITNFLTLVPFAGPTLSYGIKSIVIDEASLGDISYKGDKVNLYEYEDGSYRRFDAAFGVGTSVIVSDIIRVDVGYDWGIANRYKLEYANAPETRRNVFRVGASFLF